MSLFCPVSIVIKSKVIINKYCRIVHSYETLNFINQFFMPLRHLNIINDLCKFGESHPRNKNHQLMS
jgi:hypothetical protein